MSWRPGSSGGREQDLPHDALFTPRDAEGRARAAMQDRAVAVHVVGPGPAQRSVVTFAQSSSGPPCAANEATRAPSRRVLREAWQIGCINVLAVGNRVARRSRTDWPPSPPRRTARTASISRAAALRPGWAEKPGGPAASPARSPARAPRRARNRACGWRRRRPHR
jgi:hypothetical protein